jgi:hypothetical protein
MNSNGGFKHKLNNPNGWSLKKHYNSTTTTNDINSSWDYVVLQEVSGLCVFSEAKKNIDVYPFAKGLVDRIREKSEAPQPVFLMNAAGVVQFEEYNDDMIDSYLYMAKDNETLVVPAAIIWKYMYDNHPEIELTIDFLGF